MTRDGSKGQKTLIQIKMSPEANSPPSATVCTCLPSQFQNLPWLTSETEKLELSVHKSDCHGGVLEGDRYRIEKEETLGILES